MIEEIEKILTESLNDLGINYDDTLDIFAEIKKAIEQNDTKTKMNEMEKTNETN